MSREKEKARIGNKRRRESGTKNTGKGKAVRQKTLWMVGYSPKLISAPGFACVMSSYLSQRENVALAYVRTRLPSLKCFSLRLSQAEGDILTYVRSWLSSSCCYVFLLFAR